MKRWHISRTILLFCRIVFWQNQKLWLTGWLVILPRNCMERKWEMDADISIDYRDTLDYETKEFENNFNTSDFIWIILYSQLPDLRLARIPCYILQWWMSSEKTRCKIRRKCEKTKRDSLIWIVYSDNRPTKATLDRDDTSPNSIKRRLCDYRNKCTENHCSDVQIEGWVVTQSHHWESARVALP
jgi:hypothetical protein